MSGSLTPEVYVEKAERVLSAARILLSADNPEGACNRAYCATFDRMRMIRVTMAWHPELRWLTGTIPIWFHMDLAAFIYMLGDYQTRRPSGAARRPTP